MTDDTTRLIQQTYAGDAAAKERLARHVHQRLHRVIHQVRAKYPGVKGQDQTDDMLGDIWLKAVEDKIHLRSFPDYPAFQAYVAATAANLLKDRIKHLRHVQTHAEGVRKAGHPETTDAAGAMHDLLEAVEAVLSEEERRIYHLRFVLDIPTKEVAESLRQSEPTIRRKYNEINRKLKAHLGLEDMA